MVLSWCGVAPEKVRDDVVYAKAAWAGLAFVRERKVFKVPEAVLGRPSPRLLDGLAALRVVVARSR
jgi:ABC-type Fe3+-hydroxamate transport system substrate-binding protein